MKYVYVGKITGTHGIKGEIKIISNFEFKEKVFKKGQYIYIGKNYIREVITSYRKHKNYDMITLEGYNNINQVLSFMKNEVYIDKEDLNLNDNEILDCDIIGLDVYVNDKKEGKVEDIYLTGINYKVIEVNFNNNKVLFPYHNDFIEEINISEKYIKFKREGIINSEN